MVQHKKHIRVQLAEEHEEMGEKKGHARFPAHAQDNDHDHGHVSQAKKKLAARRGTMFPPKKTTKKPPSTYKNAYMWWHKVSAKYAFSHPYVRSRLEKLMGSNMVSLTDRTYMQQLQQRILEDYADAMGKRIAAREAEEMERVKNLVLTGKIPLDQAPPEMANHPVRLIEIYCQKLIAERRAKIKVHRVVMPPNLYWDDTPDPPSGLSIEKGHVFRKAEDNLCHPPDSFLANDEEDIENGYMFSQEEYERITYENPLISQLKECETVAEMYQLADEIIGVLKTLSEEEAVSAAPQAATA